MYFCDLCAHKLCRTFLPVSAWVFLGDSKVTLGVNVSVWGWQLVHGDPNVFPRMETISNRDPAKGGAGLMQHLSASLALLKLPEDIRGAQFTNVAISDKPATQLYIYIYVFIAKDDHSINTQTTNQ